MTHLEQFQQERIKALEQEVLRLNSQLIVAKTELDDVKHLADTAMSRISVSNPVFLQPIKYEYDAQG